MGGRIGVHSQEGHGSCFWVELGVASQAAASQQPPPVEVGELQAVVQRLLRR